MLGIETATSTASVGVSDGAEALAERSLASAASHAVSILSLIDETLHQAGIGLHELGAVAVSIGPGSFTGLRIGVSVAKGLAIARGLLITGVSTLEVLAASVPSGEGFVCPLLDARRGEVYSALYQHREGRLECVLQPRVVRTDHLPAHVRLPCRLVGDMVDKEGALLRTLLGPGVDLVPGLAPRGAVVAAIGARRIQLCGPGDLAALEPAYLQSPDAERNRMKQGNKAGGCASGPEN